MTKTIDFVAITSLESAPTFLKLTNFRHFFSSSQPSCSTQKSEQSNSKVLLKIRYCTCTLYVHCTCASVPRMNENEKARESMSALLRLIHLAANIGRRHRET